MNPFDDKEHFQKKRAAMVARLRTMGIRNEQILNVMGNIPRHFFVSPAFVHEAYEEKALPIGYGQTISHPFTVARMTELLGIAEHDRVLEIGTGSGYQTAVLCALGANLFSVEIVQALTEKAVRLLTQLNMRFASRIGDGSKGWAGYAPYDAIIVTAGAPATPGVLLEQLDPDNGTLVIPIGENQKQKLTVYRKQKDHVEIEELDGFKFVPLTGKFGWKQSAAKK